MSDTTIKPIPYDSFARNAAEQILREALQYIAKNGVGAANQLYVSFLSQHEGCDVPDMLRKKQENEITIVLQHQFSKLVVRKESFSVTLQFSGKPARLTIAFAALTGFFDPEAEFGLRLQPIAKDTKFAVPSKAKYDTAQDKQTKGQVIDLQAFQKATKDKPNGKDEKRKR